MNRYAVTILLVAGSVTAAHAKDVDYSEIVTFESNAPAKASEVNRNFQVLREAINSKADTGDTPAGGGDITSVNSTQVEGSGLIGGGDNGDLTLTVNFNEVQKKIDTNPCQFGIEQINNDGSRVCAQPQGSNGALTTVQPAAGSGLTVAPPFNGSVEIGTDFSVVQKNIQGISCPNGIAAIDDNGLVTCASASSSGGISEVTAPTTSGITYVQDQGKVTLNTDLTVLQKRVSSCTISGQYMTGVQESGAAICSTPGTSGGGTSGVSSVDGAAGSGITANPATGDVKLSLDFTNTVQRKIQNCTGGNVMTGVDSAGNALCVAPGTGGGTAGVAEITTALDSGITINNTDPSKPALGIDYNQVQAKISFPNCSSTQKLVNSSGMLLCVNEVGDISEIITPDGAGLVGGVLNGAATLRSSLLTGDASVSSDDITISTAVSWDDRNGGVRIPRTHFRNFTVEGTLTVPSGTTIRCSGDFINNGKIVVTPNFNFQDADHDAAVGSNTGQYEEIRLWPAGIGDSVRGPELLMYDLITTDAGITDFYLPEPRGGRGVSETVAMTSHYRFSRGGGGGGGRKGGNGGGLLRVQCNRIYNNGIITALGDDAAADRGGGGGAGGMVILQGMTYLQNNNGNSLIDVSGGRGGNSVELSAGTDRSYIFAGGGGGGGIIILQAPLVQTIINAVRYNGGSPGTQVNTTQVNAPLYVLPGGGGGALGGDGGSGARQNRTVVVAPLPGKEGFHLEINSGPYNGTF